MTDQICSDCAALFNARSSQLHAARLARIMKCENQCGSELLRASQYSPGVVANEEEVASCACHPNHAQKGKLIYKFSDAAFAHGMSVTRKTYDSNWLSSVEKLCKSIVCGEQKKREFHDIGAFQVGGARGIVDDNNQRAFFVYDTAAENNVAHADVVAFKYCGDSNKLSATDRAQRMVVQARLLKLVKEELASRLLR